MRTGTFKHSSNLHQNKFASKVFGSAIFHETIYCFEILEDEKAELTESGIWAVQLAFQAWLEWTMDWWLHAKVSVFGKVLCMKDATQPWYAISLGKLK